MYNVHSPPPPPHTHTHTHTHRNPTPCRHSSVGHQKQQFDDCRRPVSSNMITTKETVIRQKPESMLIAPVRSWHTSKTLKTLRARVISMRLLHTSVLQWGIWHLHTFVISQVKYCLTTPRPFWHSDSACLPSQKQLVQCARGMETQS